MASVAAKLAAAITCISIAAASGCAVRQPSHPAIAADTQANPLPFKGRLTDGNPNELPPDVALSLSNNSPITFQYREELQHDEYHIPLIVSAFDPVTYFGSPLGDYGVTAFAKLVIIGADGKVIGDYTRRAYVSASYSLYEEPTHRELEEAARAAVRAKIDQSLDNDSARLAHVAADPESAAGIAK
jgi:hypothetical protein